MRERLRSRHRSQPLFLSFVMKTNTYVTPLRRDSLARLNWNPIRSLTPTSLARILDDFHAGKLRQAALVWDAIERRDDLLQGVISKRKKSISRLDWEILTLDNSEEATRQKEILEQFYNHLSCINAYDENERGGLPLLIRQMMDAVGKRYAVHEVVFKPFQKDGQSLLTAEFRFVPLFFFENKDGRLHFVGDKGNKDIPLSSDEWLVTTGDGLMESCSIAYLFKHLPLRDWLIYCERNGMPGLMSAGTDIQAIDISGKGELPYPKLVERMDRAMAALWRGSDLTTLGRENAVGVTQQRNERDLLEEDDAQMISDTLNEQVDRAVLKHLAQTEFPKAYFHLKPSPNKNLNNDLAILKTLYDMGISLSLNDIREHFGINPPTDKNDIVQK